MMRPLLASLALIALNACGFAPMYATNDTPGSAQLAEVAVQTDRGRDGELLKAEIQDQLNPNNREAEVRYKLTAGLQMNPIPQLIEPDGTVSRFSYDIVSPYELRRLSDNVLLSKGSIRRQSSYNIAVEADYASFVAQQEVRRRAIIDLARDYALRVGSVLIEAPGY